MKNDNETNNSWLNKIDINSCNNQKTLENLWIWYTITLKKDVSPYWMKRDYFEKWDKIKINNILIGENTDTILVTFTHFKNWKEISIIKMSSWIFLLNFVTSINESDIILEEVKENTKKKVDTTISKDEEKKAIEKDNYRKHWFNILKIFKKKKKS